MNKFYPLATLLSAILLTHGTQAQTYTTVRNGNWTASGPAQVWDPSGEPPANCVGCTIIVHNEVTLNKSVTLSGGSTLYIDGSDAKLLINASNGADWASSFNIILKDDNSNPHNMLSVINGGVVDATAADAQFDGIFTADLSTPVLSFKQIGNGPSAYQGTTVKNTRTVSTQTMATGTNLIASGTLPLGLTDFDAVASNGAVNLTWNTQYEQNSDHFDIERSSNNGAKWDVIGKVAAQGNSSSVTNYNFTDANPGSGTLQYRIHGVDRDGKPTYSPIKAVRLNALASVSVFPNPAKDYVNVSLPAGEATAGQTTIRLIGQTGQLLAEKRTAGSGGSIVTFPVSSYAPGNYLIQIITADGAKQTSKVMISRN